GESRCTEIGASRWDRREAIVRKRLLSRYSDDDVLPAIWNDMVEDGLIEDSEKVPLRFHSTKRTCEAESAVLNVRKRGQKRVDLGNWNVSPEGSPLHKAPSQELVKRRARQVLCKEEFAALF